MAQQIFLGDEDFIERMQVLMDTGRDEGIVVAATGGQHSLTDIASATGLSISRVSRIVRQAEDVTG